MRAGVMHYGLWLVVLLGLPVQAASINVTAEYKPAAYEVGRAKFINTTPCNSESWSGFWCSGTSTVDQSQPLFISITIERVVKNNNNLIDALTYLSFVGARDVSLVHQNSGKSYPLKFIFTKIGAGMSPNLAKEALVNNSDWLEHIDGDCHATLNSWASPSQVHYLYDIKPENQLAGGKCYHNNFKPTFSSNNTALSKIYLGYKLNAPDPLKMENGVYKGSLVLSIGRNKDLDFGNGTYSDNQLTINFTMTVRHQIKMEFPPGSDKVVLQPPGGWHDWIYRGKSHQPPHLIAELPYRLWSSSTYNVWLNCQYPDGEYCMLSNTRTGHKVRFDVIYQNGAKEEFVLRATRIQLRSAIPD
ncbi:hypothetical protein P5G63_05170 [Aeromonas salmonicida]|uniref:hypothetical protein n=1 Tax=Aeromonas salmonicida TaxID=645 RepID=UPI00223FD8F5|nr:hypothetical protein [Aeromonas salmonicida]MDF8327916.1 hypothetical protein [Aeromonas salmonicida]